MRNHRMVLEEKWQFLVWTALFLGIFVSLFVFYSDGLGYFVGGIGAAMALLGSASWRASRFKPASGFFGVLGSGLCLLGFPDLDFIGVNQFDWAFIAMWGGLIMAVCGLFFLFKGSNRWLAGYLIFLGILISFLRLGGIALA